MGCAFSTITGNTILHNVIQQRFGGAETGTIKFHGAEHVADVFAAQYENEDQREVALKAKYEKLIQEAGDAPERTSALNQAFEKELNAIRLFRQKGRCQSYLYQF